MDNIIMCNDELTMKELIAQGCKLLKKENELYTLVNCSNQLNFENYKDRIVLTNKLFY